MVGPFRSTLLLSLLMAVLATEKQIFPLRRRTGYLPPSLVKLPIEVREHVPTDVAGEKTLRFLANYSSHLEVPLSPDEVLCNCTHPGCDQELTLLDPKLFRGVCRSRGGACKAHISRLSDREPANVYLGCLLPSDMHPPNRPLLCEPIPAALNVMNLGCCANHSFCNGLLNLPFHALTTPIDEESLNPRLREWWKLALFGVVALLLVTVVVLAYLLYRSRSAHPRKIIQSEWPLLPLQPLAEEVQTLLNQLLEESSGSGSGTALLVQRTIARQIELLEEVGRGRFGEVWQGSWRGTRVAVKIFNSRDERSWYREAEVFNTSMLRHNNILSFIAADNKDTGTAMQLWLVTEYHPHGSLFDYLQRSPPLDDAQLCRMVRSTSAGLAFLHSEIAGSHHSKPGIAHRDLKSRNVLVKSADGTCCIADLGLAVRYSDGQLDLPDNQKSGTVRYLAPEILDDTFNGYRFDSYRMADVYSLGLVIWEMARRTKCEGQAESYDLPYYNWVPREPSVEEMRRIVCENNRRPDCPNRWALSPVLAEVSRIMKESWARSSNARLTATNVRNSIDKLVASTKC